MLIRLIAEFGKIKKLFLASTVICASGVGIYEVKKNNEAKLEEENKENFISLQEFDEASKKGIDFIKSDKSGKYKEWSLDVLRSIENINKFTDGLKKINNTKTAYPKILETLKHMWDSKLAKWSQQEISKRNNSFFENKFFTADKKNSSDIDYKELVKYEIIYSFLQCADYEKLLIKPNIEINFEMEKIQENDEQKYLPIKKLKISFELKNFSNLEKNFLKKIPIESNSTKKIEIFLKKGQLKQTLKNKNSDLNLYTSWTISPNEKDDYSVKISDKNNNTKNLKFDSLQLLFFGSNKESNLLNADPLSDAVIFPGLSFATVHDIEKYIKKQMNKLNSEIVKKDIENWYGKHGIFRLKNLINDIDSMVSAITTPIIPDVNNKKISILEAVLKDSQKRNLFFQSMNLDSKIVKAIEKVIEKIYKNTNTTDGEASIKELNAFLKSFMYEIKKVTEKSEVEIIWLQEPIFSYKENSLNKTGQIVSYKFQQKIKFKEKLDFTFKGSWNEESHQTENWQESETSGKINFNFSEKDSLLTDILKIFIQNYSSQQELFEDIVKFIDWKKFTIDANSEINYFYHANESPVTPAYIQSSDKWDQKNGDLIFGWKALDVSVILDYSKFSDFFATIFGKFACNKITGKTIGITTLTNINQLKQDIKKQPLSEISNILNNLIGTYSPSSCQTTNREKNAVFLIMKSLFKNGFNIQSQQISVGFSSLFYEQYDNFIDELINTNTTAKNTTNSTPESKKYTINTTKQVKYKNESYPLRLIDSKMEKIAEKFFISFAFIYPQKLFIFPIFADYDNWINNQTISNEKFKTTNALIKNKNDLKNIIFKHLDDNTLMKKINGDFKHQWDFTNFFKDKIDKEKAKVSLVKLPLYDAINEMLGTTLNLGMIGAALSTMNVSLYDLLGKAFEREFYWVHINLLEEAGSWQYFYKKTSIRKQRYYPESSFDVMLPMIFNHCKLQTGKIPNCQKQS